MRKEREGDVGQSTSTRARRAVLMLEWGREEMGRVGLVGTRHGREDGMGHEKAGRAECEGVSSSTR
jgi:hypothetical protein